MKQWIIGVVIATAALLMPAAARAHDGHDHTVLGTISSIAGNTVMVKTTDGKAAMVMLDAKTKITQGKIKLDVKALKVGDRVVAAGPEEKNMIMAETVKVGAAPTVAAKK